MIGHNNLLIFQKQSLLTWADRNMKSKLIEKVQKY